MDFCLKLQQAGYKNIWTPYAKLWHDASVQLESKYYYNSHSSFAADVAYMKQHWGEVIKQDPAYNPNLTLSFTDMSMAIPKNRAIIIEATGSLSS